MPPFPVRGGWRGYWPHETLASALALLDRPDEAKTALDKLLELKPDFGPNDLLPFHIPEVLRQKINKWIAGLRKAGLGIPDDPSLAE